MDDDIVLIDNPTSSRRLDFDNDVSDDLQEKNVEKEIEVDGIGDAEKIINDRHEIIPKAKIPTIGMEFDNEETTYEFYNEYATAAGFNIRKFAAHKDINENILDRVFCCSCQGRRAHKINRIPSKAHLLRSHRTISTKQAAQVENIDRSGIPPKAGLTFMAKQLGGHEKVGFIIKDYRNYLRSKRTREMKTGDTGGMLEHLQQMQSEDPIFFYAIQVDEDDLITNVFWADGQMMADYMHFGDVSIVFGTSLLYDETAQTFMWLFDIFARGMSGRKPETILTDQDAAMAKALAERVSPKNIEEVDASMENRVVEKSTLGPKCGGKQTVNSMHNKEIVLDRVENSSSNVRGLKVKQNPRVTSGKRPKGGLEKVAAKRKSKNNKESSIINEHNDQTYQVGIPDLSLFHTNLNMAYVPPHPPQAQMLPPQRFERFSLDNSTCESHPQNASNEDY
ncbi:hypothetical protein BUALT_Bualt05G0088700 [Buddleja alternifolia]|uniref:Protein FAR1-RELATED SEQUENCE n=1 Tax=Buddleja alternifolia TaxID=168488 RepID=A0AAV6XR53_9LAMI|nr:hypothetical protein BUALT_Bualt05G0088700 [Buddleja alternifolia]